MTEVTFCPGDMIVVSPGYAFYYNETFSPRDWSLPGTGMVVVSLSGQTAGAWKEVEQRSLVVLASQKGNINTVICLLLGHERHTVGYSSLLTWCLEQNVEHVRADS